MPGQGEGGGVWGLINQRKLLFPQSTALPELIPLDRRPGLSVASKEDGEE